MPAAPRKTLPGREPVRIPKPSGDERPATVLIVDDHPLLRDGLRRTLGRDLGLAVCGEAGGLAEARRAVAADRPDVVVLDFDLPDGDCLAFVEELRRGPDGPKPDAPKVVVLYGRDDPAGADVQALRRGASAFLSKRADGYEVLEAVRAALSGRVYLGPDLIDRLIRRRGRPGDGA